MSTQTEIVPVQLADGTTLQVKATMLGGEEDVGAFDKVLSFSSITATVESIANALNTTIKKIRPDKASIEFGIEMAVEAGQLTALLVQGSGTGNLKITLEWGKE